MSWRDELQPGSYNGVAVAFQGDDASFGRRVKLHEYPLRDIPFAEDLGRKARQFAIECFMVGADFMQRRDALIAELERAGPGTLVHPYYGTLRVTLVEAGRIRHSSREGGMCTISLTFVESGERTFPAVSADTVQQLDSVADAAIHAVNIDFDDIVITHYHPEFVRASLIDNISIGLETLRSVKDRIGAVNGTINDYLSPVAQLDGVIDGIANNLVTLINTPLTLATEISAVIGSIFSGAQRVADALSNYKAVRDTVAAYNPVPQTTPSRVQQAQNQDAAARLFRAASLIEATRAITNLSQRTAITSNQQSPFDSRNDAEAVRDDLLVEMDNEQLTGSDDVYLAFADLQHKWIAHINAHGQTLQRVAYVALNSGLPSLVFAQQLYGNIDLEFDIVSRNRARRPALLDTTLPLEYLNPNS